MLNILYIVLGISLLEIKLFVIEGEIVDNIDVVVLGKGYFGWYVFIYI